MRYLAWNKRFYDNISVCSRIAISSEYLTIKWAELVADLKIYIVKYKIISCRI